MISLSFRKSEPKLSAEKQRDRKYGSLKRIDKFGKADFQNGIKSDEKLIEEMLGSIDPFEAWVHKIN